MLDGDRRALARLFTLLEREPDTLSAVMRAVHGRAGRAYCVGVTGPPGAGKSTIVDGLVGLLRRQGLGVGVVAVDPTSPFSGGAVLGDRIRMQRHALDPGVFIRSLATRGMHGGLCRIAKASVRLLDAFGKDFVIVETVGVGQTELDVCRVADTVVVTLVPETGDAVQAMKAGLMEIADIFVVNKADREGAERLAAAIGGALAVDGGEAGWRPPILLTKAHRGEGIEALRDQIIEHRNAMERVSLLRRRRRDRDREEFADTLLEAVGAGVAALMSQDGALRDVVSRMESGEIDPYSAATLALDEGLVFPQLARQFERTP